MAANVLNTDAQLNGKTLVVAENAQVITGEQTFARAPSPPFVVAANSAKVNNLDADKLDGQHATDLIDLIVQGRLTLTSGTPVTSADVTAATNVYFTPYKGNRVALYDGAAWVLKAFTERTLAVPATTGTNYDVFLYDNAGTLTLEAVAWTNDTTRATALALQDGVYVKNAAATNRYLGTFRTTGVAGQTEDSAVKRLVWNYYNRASRVLKRQESAASWTYSTAAWRQVNANAANQIEVVIGVAEDALDLTAVAEANNSAAAPLIRVGIGVDVTNATSALGGFMRWTGAGATTPATTCRLTHTPGIGRHFYAWLEYDQTGSGASTWFGTTAQTPTGLIGSMQS